MATVDNINEIEIKPPGLEVVRAQLTGGTSTYTAVYLANVDAAHVSVEGTNAMTWTRTGNVITITGTGDDWVNITLYGQK